MQNIKNDRMDVLIVQSGIPMAIDVLLIVQKLQPT